MNKQEEQPSCDKQGESWNKGVPPMCPQQKENETFVVSYEPKQEHGEPVAQALKALEDLKSVLTDPEGNVCWQGSYADRDTIGDALQEFEKFLAAQPAKQEQGEPVAKCAQCKKEYKHGKNCVGCPKCAPNVSVPESEFQKPITTPQQRITEPTRQLPQAERAAWVGLTDEEMLECNMDDDFMIDRETAKRNVEAKLKEKNT